MNNKILVTGVTSGLGKYLHRELNCVGLDRTNFDEVKDGEYDLIVHCAFNNHKFNLPDVLDDNIILTSKLLKFKYEKFVFISSVDVYDTLNTELYSSTKRIAEQIVALDPTSLSLRCSFLVGPNMRQNHLVKMVSNADSIGLSGNSSFNYILYSDILRFIQKKQYVSDYGHLDFMATSGILLSEVKEMMKSTTEFGDYVYGTYPGGFTGKSIVCMDEFYNRSSKYNIETYFNLN